MIKQNSQPVPWFAQYTKLKEQAVTELGVEFGLKPQEVLKIISQKLHKQKGGKRGGTTGTLENRKAETAHCT